MQYFDVILRHVACHLEEAYIRAKRATWNDLIDVFEAWSAFVHGDKGVIIEYFAVNPVNGVLNIFGILINIDVFVAD